MAFVRKFSLSRELQQQRSKEASRCHRPIPSGLFRPSGAPEGDTISAQGGIRPFSLAARIGQRGCNSVLSHQRRTGRRFSPRPSLVPLDLTKAIIGFEGDEFYSASAESLNLAGKLFQEPTRRGNARRGNA